MMKIYESPVFYAEEYTFSDSIAKCEYSVLDPDPNGNMVAGAVRFGDVDAHDGSVDNWVRLCGGNDNAGCHRVNYTEITVGGIPVTANHTIFNDNNPAGGACTFDWGGPNNDEVVQSGRSFAQTFLANSSNPGQHAPGYDGLVFYS